MRPANKRKLTQLYVARISPQPKTFCAWDTEQKGLALVVRPNGYKAYKCAYAFQSRTRWYHLAAVNEISLGQARRLAQEIMYATAQGKDPQGDKRASRKFANFSNLVEAFHATRREAKPQLEASALSRRAPSAAARTSAITRAHLKALMREVTAPVVANQTLAAASAIFSWAIREEVAGVTANPCLKVARNVVTSRERILSDSELPLFWNTFAQAGEAGKALKLILLTGQRPGEVCAMRREHIRDGWWEMPAEPQPEGTKNGRAHRVWLPEPVRELLDGSFQVTGKLPSVTQLATTMRALCAQLGISEKVTPHDLRRTHGTFITRLGFGRSAMNRIQNHAEGGIGSVYDRYSYADETKRIMEAVAGEIVRIAEGRPVEAKVVAFRA